MSDKDFARQFRIPSPCDVDWDSMIGNDRVRFCTHCQLSVHNIDFASRKQIRKLIARSKGRLCVNYRLPDVPRQNIAAAPVLYKIGRRTSAIAAGAFSATLTISSAIAATANVPTVPTGTNSAARVVSQAYTSAGATLFGYIFDPSGAVIAGAIVTLTNSESNAPRRAFTSGDGRYQFEGVEPGTYHLKVSSKGFETSDLGRLTIRENDNNRIDQTLSITSPEAGLNGAAERGEIRGGGALVEVLPVDSLVAAVMDDNLEAVKEILLTRPDANTRDKATQYSALERAVRNGNREIVQVLLWAKADVNSRDSAGETPLMMIGDETTSEIVWDLINNGAKVDRRDNDGETALMSVAETDNVEALKVLLDAGAKVNETDNEGQSALMIAAENGKVHNVRALILAGADVNARDKDGKTALMYAKDDDQPAVVRLLKAHGAIEFEQPEKQ